MFKSYQFIRTNQNQEWLDYGLHKHLKGKKKKRKKKRGNNKWEPNVDVAEYPIT